MQPADLASHTDELVASILFAWTLLKPELLQPFHSLALKSVPAIAGMEVPALDTPVADVDVDSGISLRVRNATVLRLVGHPCGACWSSVDGRGRAERSLWGQFPRTHIPWRSFPGVQATLPLI